jgi:hypothetical protein
MSQRGWNEGEVPAGVDPGWDRHRAREEERELSFAEMFDLAERLAAEKAVTLYMRDFGFDPAAEDPTYKGWLAFRRRQPVGLERSLRAKDLNDPVGRRIRRQTGVLAVVSFSIVRDEHAFVFILEPTDRSLTLDGVRAERRGRQHDGQS